MLTKFSSLIFASAIAIGCGGSGQMIHPIDLGGFGGNGGSGGGGNGGSGGGGNGGSGGGGSAGSGGGGGGGGMSGGPDMAMKVYTMSTITAFRTAAKPGDFEIDNVVVVGVTPTGGRAYVQDPAGGDLSAIVLDCPKSTCTLRSTIMTTAIGEQVTVKGTYIKEPAAKGSYEVFYVDAYTDNGKAPMVPAVQTVALADIAKTASTRAKWFQKVNVTMSDELDMYDFAPPEMAASPAPTTCGNYFYGWGMAPKSTAPASTLPLMAAQTCCATASTAACSAAATAQTVADANEILISTDFYKTFPSSTDCLCAYKYKNTVPTAAQVVAKGATVAGIFGYDATSAGVGYQYLAPLATTDFPLK
jgi:hypothetical protein